MVTSGGGPAAVSAQAAGPDFGYMAELIKPHTQGLSHHGSGAHPSVVVIETIVVAEQVVVVVVVGFCTPLRQSWR